MRVLLIEDNKTIQQSIDVILKSESFNVDTVALGREGLDLSNLNGYDIILLHLNSCAPPDLELVRGLSAVKGKTPLLVVFGVVDNEDTIKGLSLGAGDYMIKPIYKEALIARTHLMVRRSKGHTTSTVHIGDLTVNLEKKTAEIAGSVVGLTGKEYELLELLALRKDTTLTKEMILNRLYGGLEEPNAKIIDVFICKLRKKLANSSNGKNYIETIWGRGYLLRAPIEDKTEMPVLHARPVATPAATPAASMGYRKTVGA